MGEMKTRATSFTVFLLMVLLFVAPSVVHSQHSRPLREPIVVKVIRLDHADAERLASVLSPLLTKDGRITAYSPTNTLIIRDRKSLVEQLVKVIKGVSEP
jgi:type II secretory pathway component GspD/PulD (secretin)